MELTNEFTVDVGVDEAWVILTDVERIAPCMPGAQLQEVDGDEFRGVVKVKVGPITAEYKGKATFLELDPATHRAVLKAEGRETRGQGNASATITAALEPAGPTGSSTRVQVTTELNISGRVAQFGRGVMADVTSKLLGQFVNSLEATVLEGSGEPAAAGGGGDDQAISSDGADVGTDRGSASPSTDGHAGGGGAGAGSAQAKSRSEKSVPPPAAEPVNLMGVAGPAIAKRFAVPVLNVVGLIILWRVVRRVRRRRAA